MTTTIAHPISSQMRTRGSAFAWSLVGLYIVLVVLGLRFQSQVMEIVFIDVWIFFAMLWFVVIGALIVRRHQTHLIGWMFIVTALSFAAALFAQAYSIVALQTAPGSLPAGEPIAWLGFWINMPGTAVIAMFLPLLFPDGRLPSRRWRPVAWSAGGLAIVAVLASMLTPGAYLGYPNVRNPLGIEAWSGVFALVDAVTDVVFFVLIILSAAALFDRFRRADAEERLQIRWFVFAGSIVIVGFLVELMRPIIPELHAASVVLTVVAVTVMPVAVGIAILRYRLYDIDVIINKTLVYGLLTAVLAGLYTANVAIFERLLVALTGEQSDFAIILTLFVLTTVFTPIKTSLQSAVDRRLKPAKPPTPDGGSQTGIDDLVKLAELHRHGVLTDDEFSAKKRQVLGI